MIDGIDASKHVTRSQPSSRAVFRTPGRGVNAPAGSFYALEASRRLGLSDTGALRVGLAPYVDETDVDRLLTALGEFTDAVSA